MALEILGIVTIVAEIEAAILALARQDGLSVLLVEQHLGFALRAADGTA